MEKFSMLFHKLKREFACPSRTALEMSFASTFNGPILVIFSLFSFLSDRSSFVTLPCLNGLFGLCIGSLKYPICFETIKYGM